MPNNLVPSILLRRGFLTFEGMTYIPDIADGGLSEIPPWLRCGRELDDYFPTATVRNVGAFNASAYSCGGWDMQPKSFLEFMRPPRTPWNSRLYIAEIIHILACDHIAGKGNHLRSPLYFIAQGDHGEFRLIEARRNRGRGFSIESAREISDRSRILRGSPFYMPSHLRD